MATTICPFCGRQVSESRVFARCKKCALVLNQSWRADSYSDSYFTEEYRAQYGKSYEEDFEQIYWLSSSRLAVIDKLVQTHNVEKKIFEVGCAYGFFLKAAFDRGYVCRGIEISQHAAKYANTHYPFRVDSISLEEAPADKYPIVTFWYVIEHFYDIKESLNRLFAMVDQGGIVAFSVPSWYGPSYLFGKVEWENNHPKDHRIDFSPRGLRRILRKEGFRNIIIRPASYHPERILSKTNILYPLFSAIYKVYANLTCFGDTLEVFAVKSSRGLVSSSVSSVQNRLK